MLLIVVRDTRNYFFFKKVKKFKIITILGVYVCLKLVFGDQPGFKVKRKVLKSGAKKVQSKVHEDSKGETNNETEVSHPKKRRNTKQVPSSEIELETKKEILLFELKNLQLKYFNDRKEYYNSIVLITYFQKKKKYFKGGILNKISEVNDEVFAQKTDQEILQMKGTFFVTGNTKLVATPNTPVSQINGRSNKTT